jgi:hypothetical protein
MSDYKGLLVGIMALALAMPSAAEENHAGAGALVLEAPSIQARVFDFAQLRPELIKEAEQHASRIFRSAGVAVLWTAGSALDPEAHELEYRGQPDGASAPALICGDTNVCRLTVRIEPHSPARLQAGELAEALPFAHSGIRVKIYYDRVQASNAHGNTASAILGHVLAHEIGHVLLGTNRHARVGLMQASWDDLSFKLMASALLSFAPDEVRSMQERLSARQALITAAESRDQVVALSAGRRSLANK